MPGRLFVVTTPIGNLGDLSPRARTAFEAAELVACEDTRVTGRLLHHLGLKKPLVEGQKFQLDLLFEVVGPRKVQVVVRKS